MADATARPAAESPAVDHLAYQTAMIRIGLTGVNLSKSLDSLSPNELARLNNAVTGQGGGVNTRPGLTMLAQLGTNVHSAARLNDPQNSTFTRFWGVDTLWGRGQSTITSIEAGFSGKPLTQVPWQSEHSGEPWMYVADTAKMRKANRTGVSLPIGLPKAAQPTVVAASILTTRIAAFDSSDGTQAANWKGYAGKDAAGIGTAAAPTLSDVGGLSGSALRIATAVGTATVGYPSVAVIAKALDLSTLQAGATTSDDNDIIHLWLRTDIPTAVLEVRVYLICSPITTGVMVIPGTDPVQNQSAFMYAYRASDFAAAVANTQSLLDATISAPPTPAQILAEQNRQNAIAADSGNALPFPNLPFDLTVPVDAATPGAAAWTEFGAIGKPIRRGDFLKIGNAGQVGTSWANITGIMLLVQTADKVAVQVDFDDSFLTGGGNPDTSEPDAFGYDYRITNVDRRTGAESNPSAPMLLADGSANTIESLRQQINITPVAAGDAVNYYQNAWRRGGTISDDWYFVGDNSAFTDGHLITDNTSDVEALASGAVQIDHDQPITTTDTAGVAILAQPVPILFGPIEGYLFALGDPHRPGDLYWSKKEEPDHWPDSNHEAVCPPTEQLMNGGKYGGQGFVFSRERLYSVQVNLVDGSVSSMPTDCAEGMAGRWAMDVGLGGIHFVALDAVRVTRGGESEILSDNIRPLFQGQAVNGYFPVDFTQPDNLRLTIHGDDLWFGFQDTNGGRVWWIYSNTYKTWRFCSFAVATGLAYSEPNTVGGLSLIIGGTASGKAYTHSGTTDDGAAIAASVRTGALFGDDRADKLLGDLAVWADMKGGGTLTVQAFLNNETIANTAQTVAGVSGMRRYTFDAFGTQPQHADTCSVDIGWQGTNGISPTINKLGIGTVPQPEVTMNRVTAWQPLNADGESYLEGCWIDCDTGGTPRTIFAEGLLNGNTVAVSTLTVTSSNGRRLWFSWPAVHVDMVRLRPSGNCQPWMLFGQGWLSTPEPPRIAIWDSGYEMLGDTYYTGLDIECDTLGATKTIEVYADNVLMLTYAATSVGRQLLHLTLPAGRAHIYRFRATDGNVGLLYSHKWLVAAEPGEQTNWNQNYTIAGTLADKWLKGVLLECDTFGQNKTVTVEVDGAVVQTQTVNTSGRKVVQIAFVQSLGRVFRLYPTDANPGRLYSMGWLFDEEPYQLTRFETQEIRNGIDGWQIPYYADVTVKSTSAVTMTVLSYGASGLLIATNAYVLPSTAGVKSAVPVYFSAQKGVLFKITFTSAAGFWLYREESYIVIAPWAGGRNQTERPFGNDDLDAARSMRDAVLTATRSGGSLVG